MHSGAQVVGKPCCRGGRSRNTESCLLAKLHLRTRLSSVVRIPTGKIQLKVMRCREQSGNSLP